MYVSFKQIPGQYELVWVFDPILSAFSLHTSHCYSTNLLAVGFAGGRVVD